MMERPLKVHKRQQSTQLEKCRVPLNVQKTEQNIQQLEKHNVPLTLYCQCIEYIAQNLQMVDSFYGFPDLVAADIFQKAEKLGKFERNSDEDNSLRNLQLFCNEYPENVLVGLDLSYSYLALNYWLEHFLSFSRLHSLDVSNCFLGDDHEMLSHIAHLKCLKNLNLRKNCLSDKGVSSLCMPFKVFKRGPEHLTILDISENGCITKRAVQKLQCFKDLQKIDITGISIKVKELGEQWKVCPERVENLTCVKNEGWAYQVIQKWVELASQTPNQGKEPKTAKFYALKKRIKSQVVIKDSRTVSFVPQYRLVLHRVNSHKTIPAAAPSTKCVTPTEPDDHMDSIMNLYKTC